MHDVDSKTVLAEARELGVVVRSASSVVPPDLLRSLVDRLPAPTRGAKKLVEARSLVIAAFREAKLKGKGDWDRMRISVFKNRLLNVTNRSFNEADYGAGSIQHFVALLPDLLEVDTSTAPWTVLLKDAESNVPDEVAEDSGDSPKQRIRPDLWRATVDYRSATPYVWDPELRVARPGSGKAGDIKWPTIDRETARAWRSDFVAAIGATDDPIVLEWLDRGFGTRYLPTTVQGEWNGFLRDAVVRHIRDFFASNRVDEPSDILVDATELERWRDAKPQRDDAEELRRLVTRCVAVMTKAELGRLPLPADVVARALLPADTPRG